MTSLVEVIGIAGRRAQGYAQGASRSVPILRQEARLAPVVRLRGDKFKNSAKHVHLNVVLHKAISLRLAS